MSITAPKHLPTTRNIAQFEENDADITTYYAAYSENDLSVMKRSLQGRCTLTVRDHPATSRNVIFLFPWHSQTRPLSVVLKSDWVKDLRSFANSCCTGTYPLTIVAADSAYTDVVLNWLIFAVIKAGLSLNTILVASFDEILHDFLKTRKVNSIHIEAKELFDGDILERRYAKILITRMSLMRLTNHFGYDVVHYDPDAILLKDPWPIFYDQYCDSDIIASQATYPFEIHKEYGVTMCMGSVFLRSTPATGNSAHNCPVHLNSKSCIFCVC